MVSVVMGGKKFLLVNVYAPSDGGDRVNFYIKMKRLQFPPDEEVICGGDFNCVLDTMDRSGRMDKDDQGARELQGLVSSCGWIDADHQHETNSRDQEGHASTHHTYRHRLQSGELVTSRLDRWYVEPQALQMVRGITVAEPACQSDHRTVLLEMHPPGGPIRLRKTSKLYPAPAYVETAMRSLIQSKLGVFENQINRIPALELPKEWDSFKSSLANEMTVLTKEARQRTTRGFRQKIKRLKQQLAKLQYEKEEQYNESRKILAELQAVQDTRRLVRRRALIFRSRWNTKTSTRFFFRRICTKFGDTIIPRLRQIAHGVHRSEHQQADILADNWTAILNGAKATRRTSTLTLLIFLGSGHSMTSPRWTR
ncbi:reverse transcriptase [Phytophthora megakarya]|uniref:Reverse transcriptase n=1 Tax=Phytophthora megakarya TaxID=4795 RepID=A0A225WZU0_9STRA|nr:reverse transcriptase [Phytophthora megakarya]